MEPFSGHNEGVGKFASHAQTTQRERDLEFSHSTLLLQQDPQQDMIIFPLRLTCLTTVGSICVTLYIARVDVHQQVIPPCTTGALHQRSCELRAGLPLNCDDDGGALPMQP